MKNNIIPINKYEQEINIPSLKNEINNLTNNNNLSNNDIQKMKISLNKLRNICNVLKEKNTIIDSMLLSTKKHKKILSQQTLEKESELVQLENEINIYYNKLFSDYIHTDINKRKILSKLKLIKEELTQRKYIDYLNKKIMVEQKEDKIQQGLSQLSTEQLEKFNNEIFNNQINNDKEKSNYEIMKKHYEDIKKTDIYHKIFSEIKDSLYNDKNNDSKSVSSFYNKKDNKKGKKFNSKMINESSNYFQPYSVGNSGMRSEMLSNIKKKQRINNSTDTRNYNNSNENLNKNQKNFIDSKSIRNKSFVENSYAYKKKKRFNSKLFMLNNNS